MNAKGGEITVLLERLRGGDADAEARLAERVYAELRRLARIRMAAERPDHTLSPTALANEVWLRIEPELAGRRIEDRHHFFAMAATAMRRILVEHARARKAGKRRGGRRTSSDLAGGGPPFGGEDMLALDAALSRLSGIKPRAARVVELRFFAGLSHQEIAAMLKLERRTVDRDWAMARAWLSEQLSPPGGGDA